MADASRKPPKQYEVRKDTGEWWTMTYGGPQGRGVHWDPMSLDERPGTSDPSRKYDESMSEDKQRAGQWSGFFEELLIRFLDAAEPYVKDAIEEAKPHIRTWWEETGLPWVKTAAKSAWKRVTQKTSSEPDHANNAEEARVTDVDPSTAIKLAHGVEDDGTTQSVNLTAEQAQKQLEGIAVLTKFVAAKLSELSDAVVRETDESDERFLARREEAEQLALRNVTSNIQLLLIQGVDLGDAVALLADNTPLFAAGRVEAGPLSIESSSDRLRAKQARP